MAPLSVELFPGSRESVLRVLQRIPHPSPLVRKFAKFESDDFAKRVASAPISSCRGPREWVHSTGRFFNRLYTPCELEQDDEAEEEAVGNLG